MIIGISGYMGSGKDTIGKIIMDTDGYWASRDDMGAGSRWYWNDNAKRWQIKKFATKLKQIASLLTGIPVERFEDQEFKKSYLSKEWDNPWVKPEVSREHPLKVREFLQRLGSEAIRDNLHKNAWVNALFADYKPLSITLSHTSFNYVKVEGYDEATYPNWIIPDTRFPNEAQAIKDRGGIVIRVNRYVPLEMYHTGLDGKMVSDINKSVMRHQSETSLDDWEFDYVIENNGTIEELTAKVKIMLQNFNL